MTERLRYIPAKDATPVRFRLRALISERNHDDKRGLERRHFRRVNRSGYRTPLLADGCRKAWSSSDPPAAWKAAREARDLLGKQWSGRKPCGRSIRSPSAWNRRQLSSWKLNRPRPPAPPRKRMGAQALGGGTSGFRNKGTGKQMAYKSVRCKLGLCKNCTEDHCRCSCHGNRTLLCRLSRHRACQDPDCECWCH